MPPMPVESKEKYDAVINNELIPQVAASIDKRGGLCRLELVTMDQAVRKIRAKLPVQGPEYKISKILSKEAEFFTLIHDGDKIATATAYETGLVDQGGDVTPEGLKHLEEMKQNTKEEIAQARVSSMNGKAPSAVRATRGGVAKAPAQAISRMPVKGNVTMGDRRQMAQHLSETFLNGTDQEFDFAVRQAKQLKLRIGRNPRAPVANVAPRARLAAERTVAPARGGIAGGVKRQREPLAKQGMASSKRTKVEPKQQQVTDGEKPEVEMIMPDTTPQQMKQIERMMRLSIDILRREPDQSCCLSKMADDLEIKKNKTALNGASFGSLFSTCYSSYFELEKDEQNQMHVRLVAEPSDHCPPEEIPMVRKNQIPRGGRVRGGKGSRERGAMRGGKGGKNSIA